MRVLHINSGNLYGGIEVLLGTLARHRALCPSLEPEFALCFPGRTQQELADTGVPVHMLGAVRISRPWTIWQARLRLLKLLQGHSFDAVICHGAWSLAIFARAVRKSKVPLVFWLHAPPSPRRLHWLERLASWNPPDLTICNSDFTRTEVGRLFPQGKSTRIYYPVHFPGCSHVPEERRALRQKYDTAEGDVVLLQAGRWDPYKGHMVLLEALARLVHLPGWTCWQVGVAQNDGERIYLGAIQEAIVRLGIAGRMRFLGFQDNQFELPGVMAAADVFCQPNIAPEAFGIVFIEALYTGLPVVSSDFGGPAEIIDDTCGVLVPPNRVDALADSIGTLIQSAELRRRLGDGGPVRVRALCDPAARLQQLCESLEPLCNS